MTKNKQLAVNLASNLVLFATSIIINFFFSPYIVKTLGVEANGFVGLSANFVSYATLVAISLNSMAGRFITISIHQGKLEEANKYYSTVMFGNIVLTMFMLLPAIFCVTYLENIISIPLHLVWDVKLLFSLTFLTFFVNTLFSIWGAAAFVTNKLYLTSIRSMQSQILRVLIILALFYFFKPSVYFMGAAALTAIIFETLYSYHYKQILLPDIRVKKSHFDMAFLSRLLSSGVWNSITQSGSMLLSGLDLLIANIFVGSTEMGLLALAKTLPNAVLQFSGYICSVFVPSLTIYYAKNDINGLKSELKKGMRITGVILTIPLGIIIVYGREFFSLWVPAQDATVLHILSVLSCFGLIFTSGIQPLYSVFSVTNKLKVNSILMLISGALSTLLVFILLKNTTLGIFAIAGVSSCINVLRNMCYAVPFTAKYLGLKWTTFFPEVFMSVLSVATLLLVGYGIQFILPVTSWISLIYSGVLTGCIGFITNVFIVLKKNERKILLSKLKSMKLPR